MTLIVCTCTAKVTVLVATMKALNLIYLLGKSNGPDVSDAVSLFITTALVSPETDSVACSRS